MTILWILDKFRKWNNPTRQMSYNDQIAILDRITSRAGLEDGAAVCRSYCQYKAQKYLNYPLANIALNFGCTLVLPLLFLMIRSRRFGSTRVLGLALSGVRSHWLPDSAQGETVVLMQNGFRLDLGILEFLWRSFWIHPCFEPYFWVKNALVLSRFSHALSLYDTGIFYVSCEYSFTSSMITGYLEQKGIQVINVMHGEKIFNIRDAFFHFHKMYVWDEHYVDLFRLQRASVDEFIVQVPKFLNMLIEPRQEVYDLTYYLDYNNEADLKIISGFLRNLPCQLKVCIRFHPVYGSVNQAAAIFPGIVVESPHEVSLAESFARTRLIVSRYSTVLFQGYLNGRVVMIDDLTAPAICQTLNDLHYIMMNKEVTRFSQWINELKPSVDPLVERPEE